MARKQEQKWCIGDVFLVETKDGMHVVGQVVGQERDVLNCVSCAFFDLRVKEDAEVMALSALPGESVFAILFATRDLLDDGTWRVVKRMPSAIDQAQLPYEHLRRKGFVGATVRGSGIVNDFLDAYYALAVWDDWYDPAYLDSFLVSPDKKPKHLILKNR